MYRNELPNLPLVKERFWNTIKDYFIKTYSGEKPEFSLYSFPQLWGSTSLGFGEIGGQAMTTAYTTIVVEEISGFAGVFFRDRLAYVIREPNSTFYKDLGNHDMCGVDRFKGYERSKEI